jgi:hypothetical protein
MEEENASSKQSVQMGTGTRRAGHIRGRLLPRSAERFFAFRPLHKRLNTEICKQGYNVACFIRV